MPFRFSRSLRCAEGILGTGGGVPPKTGTLTGLAGVLAGPGMFVGGRPASPGPRDDLLADLFAEGVGVDVRAARV
jgi:hypothetical protein